jgi:DNA-binding SARP family transcriptional activator/energy-coupling factor transporter ATP-binding protein EcfA2
MSRPSTDPSGELLDVRLLGDVRVNRNGSRLPGFDSLRLQRLVAYLSLGEAHNRARLAYEMWPDSSESQALGNLRKLLHDLRRELPDAGAFLDVTQQTIGWKPSVKVDVAEFRRALGAGDLAGAASTYGGDLLPGSYDDRIVAERDRLRADALAALLQLSDEALASGDDEPAAGYARRALAVDNLSERAYRLLMTASARMGNRADAYRTYHRCVEVLRKELDVEPDARTRAVYESLSAAAEPQRTAQLPSSRFVGRPAELATAHQAWRDALRGRPQLLLVTGEPGIGKSRLVDELSGLAADERATVASSRAYQAAGRPPWGPVVEWLRSPGIRSSLERLPPVWRNEVARLLPELRDGELGPAALAPDGETGRQRLIDALRRALSPGSRPLLLVADDLQWADNETIQLIGHLLVTARDAAPLMVAATLRPGEVDEGHPVVRLKEALERDRLVTEIQLGRLDLEASRLLASSLLGRTLEAADAEQLWRDTEGQPLFIVEAARTGLTTGEPTTLSRTVRAVISSRLAQLSGPARRMVEVAATIGRSFSVEVLAAASGSDQDDLVDALDEAWRRQVIREQPSGYDFSHDRIREVAYEMIPPARRRSLHRAVAGALEARESPPGSASSVIAAHYEAAGMLNEAVAAFQRAGRRSVEVFALEDAIAGFRHGLVLLEQLPPGKAREEAELEIRMALGVPLVALEGYGSDAVQDCYTRAMALCERLGRQVEPPVLRGLGLASLMSCRFDRSARFGETLLQQASNDPTATVEGHYLLGVGSFWRGDLTAASGHLQKAIDSFRREDAGIHLERYAQDPRAVSMVRLAVAELWRGRPSSSARLAEEAVGYAASLNHPTTEGYVRMYTAMLAAERDEPRSLTAEVEAGQAIWSGRRLGYFSRVGDLMRGWLDVVAHGDAAGLAGTLEGWGTESQTLHLTYGMVLLMRALLRNGEAEAGAAVAAEALRWTEIHDQRYLEPEIHRLQGELALLGGERDGGIRLLRRSMAVARSQDALWFELKAACSLARHEPGPENASMAGGVLSDLEDPGNLPLAQEARRIQSGHTF